MSEAEAVAAAVHRRPCLGPFSIAVVKRLKLCTSPLLSAAVTNTEAQSDLGEKEVYFFY